MMFKIIVITPPDFIPDEAILCNALFARGLTHLHLRKPKADISSMRRFLEIVEPKYRSRIVIHGYAELVEEYGLMGVHLKGSELIGEGSEQGTNEANAEPLTKAIGKIKDRVISISCHSIEEIERVKTLDIKPRYILLSPIYESISKKGYGGDKKFDLDALKRCEIPIIALGGITPERVEECRQMGFSGVASLGYIWDSPEEAPERYISLSTPTVLSIAGFDPSSGAGITADIKSFEMCGAYGLTAVSAITYQNSERFDGCNWLPKEMILRELENLDERGHRRVSVAKIGLIENGDTLLAICRYLRERYPGIYILWDPILRPTAATSTPTESTWCSSGDEKSWSSSGERESWCNHAGEESLKGSQNCEKEGWDALRSESWKRSLPEILKEVDLITPNLPEAEQLFKINNDSPNPVLEKKGPLDSYEKRNPHATCESGGKLNKLSEIAQRFNTAILLKGGHSPQSEYSTDTLYLPNGDIEHFALIKTPHEKHGTGCFLSSTIVALIAKGASLREACTEAQVRVLQFLESNESRLGYHHIGRVSKSSPEIIDTPLMFITAPHPDMTIPEEVELICRGGVRWIQLRMKESSDSEMLAVGRRVKEICRRYSAIFIVNDRVEIARALDSDGVHLGKSDMNPIEARKILGEEKIIGATCNTFEDLKERSCEGVDYVGLGPYRFTTTKRNLSPTLGLEGYLDICTKARESGIELPIYAIGGITEEDIPSLFTRGISGVAISGAILNAPDIEEGTEEMVREVNESIKNSKRDNG